MFREETTGNDRCFPNPQPMKFNCSKLFNLKTDGGMSNETVSKPQVSKLKISNVTEKERALKKQLGSFIKAFTYENFNGSQGLYLLQGLQIEKR